MGSTLTFSAGAWLWPALATGVVALVALAWGYRRAAGHPWRWRLAVLKALGCAALVLCLLEPTWVRQRARPGANLFAVLADNSQSLQVRDPGATRARGAAAWSPSSRPCSRAPGRRPPPNDRL